MRRSAGSAIPNTVAQRLMTDEAATSDPTETGTTGETRMTETTSATGTTTDPAGVNG